MEGSRITSGANGRDSGVVARWFAAAALSAYIAPYLWMPSRYSLLDHVDLAIHEAGHVVFAPFGEFMGIAGGSLLQVVVPLAFVAHFAMRDDRFSAAVVLLWVAQSLFNLATYVGDARARLLPLVGGPDVIHDWEWILLRLRLLDQDRVLAGLVRSLAALTWLSATVAAVWYAPLSRRTAMSSQPLAPTRPDRLASPP
jgi:hypothetical protein